MTGALAPYRVLDLTTELGALAPRVLAGLGAEVIRIEPPGGDPLRDHGPLLDPGDGAPSVSLWWLQQMAGRASVTLDLDAPDGREAFLDLCATADLVVESRPLGWFDARGAGWTAAQARNPALSWVAISPFGQTGPRAGWRATDLIGMASGGLLSLCGDRDRPPVRPTVAQGYALAGLHGAAGGMAALTARNRLGAGQFVDVSMQGAVLNALGNARLYAALEGIVSERTGGGRSFGSTGTRLIYPSADGYIAFFRVADSYALLAAWLQDEGYEVTFDPEEWAQLPSVSRGDVPAEKLAEVERAVEALFAVRTTVYLYHEGQQRGLMTAPVATPADLCANPQLAARDFFVDVAHPELGRTLRYPGAPVRLGATPWHTGSRAPATPGDAAALPPRARPVAAPLASTDSRRVLEGVRVADFSWVGVGPIATQALAFLGADVIRVESATRLDILRQSGPYPPGTTGPDRSAYWANFNRDKRAMTLNLRHPRALEVALRLAAVSDVLTESFSPGFLAEVGLTYEAVRAVNPSIIMISMSMEGQYGPHARYKGFGLTLQASAGITHLTGWPDRAPTGTGVAYSDWSATWLANATILAALDHRRRTGEGQYIDFSQLEAMTLTLEAALLDHAATGRNAVRAGNADPAMAPHGVYPVAGEDRWIAIAVEDDAQWRALCGVLDLGDTAGDAELGTAAGRLARREWLDARVAEATAGEEGAALAERLQDAGVPAYGVCTVADVEHDPQIVARGQLWQTEHPVIGPMTWDAPGYQLTSTPLYPARPAPLLGEHNFTIYCDLLGYSESEIADLVADGVMV